MIYLDHAAATPISGAVLHAMMPYLTDNFYNPSALYLSAKQASRAIDDARAKVAASLGARPAEVIFTAGGTEANNLAIQGVMRAFPGAEVLMSAIEHDSVLRPAELFKSNTINAKSSGVVDVDDLRAKIGDNTVLVSVMYVNNEVGTIQPITEISGIIREIKADRKQRGVKLPLYLHTDACQAGNYLHLNASKLGVDLMTLNSGKLYGPKQTGALFVKTGTTILPLILGGGQERNLRSGTENVANIVGFAEALAQAQAKRGPEAKRLEELRRQFINMLEQAVPAARLTSNYKHILPNNIHIIVDGQDNERLMMALDEAGVLCAVGSACSASSDEPSHVLSAIGLTDDESRSSLRLTMGRATTESDIKIVVSELTKLIV